MESLLCMNLLFYKKLQFKLKVSLEVEGDKLWKFDAVVLLGNQRLHYMQI